MLERQSKLLNKLFPLLINLGKRQECERLFRNKKGTAVKMWRIMHARMTKHFITLLAVAVHWSVNNLKERELYWNHAVVCPSIMCKQISVWWITPPSFLCPASTARLGCFFCSNWTAFIWTVLEGKLLGIKTDFKHHCNDLCMFSFHL